MTWHLQDEISFEPPPDWLESTTVRFNPPPSPPGSAPVPSITASLQPLAPGETLRFHADRLLMLLAREVADLEVLSNEEATIGGRPTIMLRIVLKSGTQPDQPIDQTMALVGAGSEREPKLVVFSLACPPEVADANRARFEKVLRTVRFDEPATVPPAATSGRPAPPALEIPLGPMPGTRSK